MSGHEPEEATGRLSFLRNNYRASLPDRLRNLQELGRKIASANAWTEVTALLLALKSATHMLAGSAPTFGFEEVGSSARTAERLAVQILNKGEMPTGSEISEIEGILALAAGAMLTSSQETLVKHVAIIGGRDGLTPALARELQRGGYAVSPIHDEMAALTLPATLPLTAIFVETGATSGVYGTWLDRFNARRRAQAPVIFFGETGDWHSRYAAAKAGAVDYLAAPLAMEHLLTRIESCLSDEPFRPYRVLCAGEGLPLLDGTGLLVRSVTDPAELLADLDNFQPEILILSSGMASHDPAHIARVVWQHGNYAHIGIFFVYPNPTAAQMLLTNGITDAYCLTGPLDPVAMRNRIVRYAHECRAGLRPPNSQDFARHLSRMTELNLGSRASTDLVVSRSISTSASPIERARPKILIVDDDQYLVAFLANALSTRGMDVLRAYSGQQGYAVAWQQMPSAIISDVEMPNGCGDQMILQLRSNPRTRTIPVIIMTGRRWEDGRDYALERELRGRLGASSYLQKPVEVDDVVRELARF